ncbi:unnamed protein product (macronuclear) [Paramecium tetraurelia]|uniref:Dephospho-CoA kinase n=1 Tax=Paramecium tetraurelia TaxID=5888 RepID=A0EAL7_PARTE|nr:uncharacterized protein GSPATT00025068001 [Paramecium tetraurelia]CAK92334.1 unnamed protein product [Paramecium tetraurelia]|eukprot:XP_001459731.1 hypothetical protein (macronuclear) [Paramecium tetraurelia strain d4-2]
MEQLNSEEQVIIEEINHSEHTEIHIIEYICYPFYLALLCLLCILINLNKRKFRRRYRVDEIFLFIAVYLFNVLITWNFFDFFDKIVRFIITLIIIFGIQHYIGRVQIVGVTGGIGCGKSTVAKYFNEFLKVQVIDCDQIARDIVEPGKPAYKLIVQRFGLSILAGQQDGQPIERQKLADVVFQDNQKRKQLQAITNKFIFKEIAKSIWKICFVQKDQYVVIDAPLLFESKVLEYFCFPIITIVVTSQEEIIKRVKERSGLTEEQILQRIESQMKAEIKIKKSDIVITNDKSEKSLIRQVQEKVFEYLI